MDTSSHLINTAINELAQFPGIGNKSALRMVIHLLKRPAHETEQLANALQRMRTEVRFCETCNNLSDDSVCNICASPSRNHQMICVVKEFQDIIAIENTGQFGGTYHVLGGLISPVDGIGPQELNIASFFQRVVQQKATEVIIALSATLEGDTTEFYLAKKLQELSIPVSSLSKGISVGGELEYADEFTLARSLKNRTPLSI